MMNKERLIAISCVVLGLGFFVGIFLGSSNITFPAFSREKADDKLQWNTYTYPDKNFSVKFLTKPILSTKPIVIGSESMNNTWASYVSSHNGTEYRVDTFMLPSEYVDLGDTQKTLTNDAKIVMSLVAPSASSNPRNPRFITSHGYPTIEYTFVNEGTNMQYKMQTFHVGNILYSVGIGYQSSLHPDFKKFITSFTLIQ